MTIEAIDVDTVSLNFESPMVESLKGSEAAEATYQDPGVNSGNVRMVQEERLSRAVNRNVSRAELGVKCQALEKIILESPYSFEHDDGYLQMARSVAPYDPQLALTFVEKIESWEKKTLGFLEVSKYQQGAAARDSIAKSKGVYGSILSSRPSTWMKIYEEEKRRGFPEAGETFHDLYEKLKADANNNYYCLDLAKVERRYEMPGLESTLSHAYENAKKDLKSDRNPIYFQYSLLSLGKYLGQAEMPLAVDVIHWLRDNIKTIQAGQFDHVKHEEDCPQENAIRAYRYLIEMEAKCPFLEPQLNEDLSGFLEFLQNLREQHSDDPEALDEFTFYLRLLASDIIPYRLDIAEVLLQHIDDSWERFAIQIEMFDQRAKSPRLNKESEFKVLEALFWKEFSDSASFAVAMFNAAVKTFGFEEAIPFFQKAKENANAIEHPFLQQFAYIRILNIESKYGLESMETTLQACYDLIPKLECRDFEFINAMIAAEFSQKGDRQ